MQNRQIEFKDKETGLTFNDIWQQVDVGVSIFINRVYAISNTLIVVVGWISVQHMQSLIKSCFCNLTVYPVSTYITISITPIQIAYTLISAR